MISGLRRHAEGLYPDVAAGAVLGRSRELPSGGRVATVRRDPATSAHTSIGPAACDAFERTFGRSSPARWPSHCVADGLNQIEVLLDKGCRGSTPAA